MRERKPGQTEQGFSLIELMIAMVVTVIVTGAVFQLMNSTQTAFRREPEVADRQQSIRVAMDRIWNDVLRAGSGMPAYTQVFGTTFNDVGVTSPNDGAPGGTHTDEISFIAMADCPPLEVCLASGGDSLTTRETLSTCNSLPSVVILGTATEVGLFYAVPPGAGAAVTPCIAGPDKNGHALFQSSHPLNPNTGQFFPSGDAPTYMVAGEGVRYRIAPEDDGTPALWRTNQGPDVTGHGKAIVVDWQIVARGVEDLQVEYFANGAWTDTPPVVAGATATLEERIATVVQKVRINLSARSNAPALQGETNSATGRALRGELMSEIAPRAARAVLAGTVGGS